MSDPDTSGSAGGGNDPHQLSESACQNLITATAKKLCEQGVIVTIDKQDSGYLVVVERESLAARRVMVPTVQGVLSLLLKEYGIS